MFTLWEFFLFRSFQRSVHRFSLGFFVVVAAFFLLLSYSVASVALDVHCFAFSFERVRLSGVFVSIEYVYVLRSMNMNGQKDKPEMM